MILETKHIDKRFVKQKALDDVNITVPEQQIFGLLGPNGAGKTTLLRIINQIIKPDSGQVFFDGRPLCPNDVNRIGYLPEERGLYKKMKVGEQCLYFARLKGMTKVDARKRLTHWFEKFEIMNWWNKKVEELSKGMQQKIQFVTTIIHEPELLIFDEPFSGFDPINTNLLKKEILLLKDQGATVIFSTHNMNSVEEICDEIVLINNARKILKGNVKKLRNDYKRNEFSIMYRGVLPDNILNDKQITVKKHEYDTTGGKLLLGIETKTRRRDIFSNLMTQVEIISFYEKLPTMSDIFIEVVRQDKHT